MLTQNIESHTQKKLCEKLLYAGLVSGHVGNCQSYRSIQPEG
jgi:hypothetical protein